MHLLKGHGTRPAERDTDRRTSLLARREARESRKCRQHSLTTINFLNNLLCLFCPDKWLRICIEVVYFVQTKFLGKYERVEIKK